MRFKSLHVENFRAVRLFEVDGVSDFILIAGPNGCGKTCILDAIRLLKSVYGGYQANEVMQWFGEFQINLNNRSDLSRLFRDPNAQVAIQAEIQLSDNERSYLQKNAEAVLEPQVWQAATGASLEAFNYSTPAIATQYRQFGPQVEKELMDRSAALRESLKQESFPLAFSISPSYAIAVAPAPTIEAIFQTYDPAHLGVIDYHSATRAYQRETIAGINLDVRNVEAQRRQTSLYNWQAKYQNVKSDLAAGYLRELIAEKSGVQPEGSNLVETLQELFQTFFPDKEFLGVTPDPTGGLTFPVKLASGETHDINELSSGEKEVLYGYLRLRNSTPRNSTILLDEPELHLNPGLLRGFPDFYHRNIGKALGNQLWLVTHSDALLRQAVGNRNYSVFHMTMAAQSSGNQALPIIADDELESAIIDLVGDLATYRPKGKVVVVEGGGDSEFDVLVIQRLFPDFARRVNLISGGSKKRVQDLYHVLESAGKNVGMAERFFAVVDRDAGPAERPRKGAHVLSWDSYHIENYLLEIDYLRAAAAALLGRDPWKTDDQVKEALKRCAQLIAKRLVLERLSKNVNDEIVQALGIRADPKASDPAAALLPSIVGSYERLDSLKAVLADAGSLNARASEIETALNEALADGSWTSEFPGRLMLRQLVATELAGKVNYEGFRNVILDQMADDSFQPSGMMAVIDAIENA